MDNEYIPEFFTIEDIFEETEDTKTYTLDRKIDSSPGQFLQVFLPVYGEAPISISSHRDEKVKLTVRSVGDVTRALGRLKKNDRIGIRGPFGLGWPIEKARGKNVVIIAGGIGLAPLRPVVKEIENNRDSYEKVILLYGARTPDLILYKKELEEWTKFIDVKITVDYFDKVCDYQCKAWQGDVGVVTKLLDKSDIPLEDNYAFMCGPPIMMKYSVMRLIEMGFSVPRIYISLERHMKCGMGFCGHCQIGGKYACKDGPVFSVEDALTWSERPEELEGIR